MLNNHIKIALRSLCRRKGLSAIHIVGLGIALAAATLLFLTAMFELSFDNFHKDRDRVGMIYFKSNPEKGTTYSETVPTPLAPALKSELADIELLSRYQNGGVVLFHDDKQFDSSNKFVDADFLEIFDFPLLEGSRRALDGLDNIVIGQNMAEALFGQTDVLGNTVQVYLNGEWTSKIITGVIAKIPQNSSLTFSSLLRFEHKPNYNQYANHWNHNDHAVFIKTADTKIDAIKFNTQARPFMANHFKTHIEELQRDGAQQDHNGEYLSLNVLPFKDYHLNDIGIGDGGSTTFPWMLLIIAGLIVFIACSNFINLSLAASLSRIREVGTRKTLGSTTGQLVRQLWTESFLISLIALIFGFLLAWLLLPEYNANMNYSLKIGQLFSPINISLFIAVFFIVTLIAGGYPAWTTARTNIIDTLKGGKTSKSRNHLRNTLTVFQFSIAIVLVIGTIVIGTQLHYMANQPLGYNKTEVISIPIGRGVNKQNALDRMRTELATIPFVSHVSGADINMGRGRDGSTSNSVIGFGYEGRNISTHYLRVDYDYLSTLDIQLLAGRDFSRAFRTDTAAVIINEQMAAQLGGIERVLDKKLDLFDGRHVIGVVKDFNFKDLRRSIEPLTMSINSSGMFQVEYIFVRVNTDNLAQSLAKVEGIWKKNNPNATASASYLDENTQNLYQNDRRFANIIMSGTAIAIIISCLGLFAIVLLSINTRIKEIGIRKVLGSSVSSIVTLLSKDFVKLVLIALVIASPIAWWMMNKWLDSFAYRIDIEWWIFALAGIIAMAIALLTVSGQAIRAAVANPVDSLRDE